MQVIKTLEYYERTSRNLPALSGPFFFFLVSCLCSRVLLRIVGFAWVLLGGHLAPWTLLCLCLYSKQCFKGLRTHRYVESELPMCVLVFFWTGSINEHVTLVWLELWLNTHPIGSSCHLVQKGKSPPPASLSILFSASLPFWLLCSLTRTQHATILERPKFPFSQTKWPVHISTMLPPATQKHTSLKLLLAETEVLQTH